MLFALPDSIQFDYAMGWESVQQESVQTRFLLPLDHLSNQTEIFSLYNVQFFNLNLIQFDYAMGWGSVQ